MQNKAPWKIAQDAAHPSQKSKKPPVRRKWGEKATKKATWMAAFPPRMPQDGPERPKRSIRSVSKRQARLNAIYALKAEAFKLANPFCACCLLRGIVPPHSTDDVHHRRGRGRYLLDERFYSPVCRECHQLLDQNRAWAYSVGMLESRLQKDTKSDNVEQ